MKQYTRDEILTLIVLYNHYFCGPFRKYTTNYISIIFRFVLYVDLLRLIHSVLTTCMEREFKRTVTV